MRCVATGAKFTGHVKPPWSGAQVVYVYKCICASPFTRGLIIIPGLEMELASEDCYSLSIHPQRNP